MPKRAGRGIECGKPGRRVIEADFSGGDLSSDGGLMLLRQVDRRIGLTRLSAGKLSDPRDPGRIRHSLRTLQAQRIDGLCCGYKGLNDHARLRNDLVMQTAVDCHLPLSALLIAEREWHERDRPEGKGHTHPLSDYNRSQAASSGSSQIASSVGSEAVIAAWVKARRASRLFRKSMKSSTSASLAGERPSGFLTSIFGCIVFPVDRRLAATNATSQYRAWHRMIG